MRVNMSAIGSLMLMMWFLFPARSLPASRLPACLRQTRHFAAHCDVAQLGARETELAVSATRTTRDLAAIAKTRRTGVAGQSQQFQARLVALFYGQGLVGDDRFV